MTITEDILGRNRKFEPTRKPIVFRWEEDPSSLDPELKKLKHVMVKDTPDNREYCFWTDSLSQSFTYITAATIIGDGVRVRCDNSQAKRLIEDFNNEINVNRKSIEDYITSSWIDEIVHANSFWRVDLGKDYTYGVDIQRLDPKTIIKIRDPKYGWLKLRQQVGTYKSWRSKASFYRRASKYDNIITRYPYQSLEIDIPDEPDVILRTSFFIKPPIGSALHWITYKRYISYFMRKYSQKFWTPFILFLVGDPKTNYYPEDDDIMQDQINNVSEVAPNIVNYGGLVLPGNVRAEELGKNSARSSEIYVTYLEAMDKQIMYSIFASMGLRDASGNEVSTQRGLRETYYQFLQGMRRRYRIIMENFYARCLCPANNIKITPRDVALEFSPLKFEASEEYMRAVEIGRKTGMFLDRNEIRKAGKTVWSWLDPVSEADNKKVDFQIPLQTSAGGDSRSLTQKVRQKVNPTTTTL